MRLLAELLGWVRQRQGLVSELGVSPLTVLLLALLVIVVFFCAGYFVAKILL